MTNVSTKTDNEFNCESGHLLTYGVPKQYDD